MLRGRALRVALVALVAVAGARTGDAADGLAAGRSARVATTGDTRPRAVDLAARYAIDAALDPAARTLAGTVTVTFTNPTGAPLVDVALVLYPNRFAVPDPAVNDLNRPYVYPREEFVPGGMTVEAVEVRGTEDGPGRDDEDSAPDGSGADDGATAEDATAWTPVAAPRREPIGAFPDTLLRVWLPRPLASGASLTLRARFRTVFPERFGPFGVAAGRFTALDGWFPALPALAVDGRWDPATPTRPAPVEGTLAAPSDYQVFVGETLGPEPPAERFDFAVPAGSPPTLFAAADYVGRNRDVDRATVVLAELPARWAFRLLRGTPHHERVLDAVERILRERPAGVPLTARALVLIEAPLRLELTAPGAPHLAVVSDRLLRVHRLLRDFHERELAQAVYAALLWQHVAARETPADLPWVLEGVAAALADRWLAAAHPRHRTVYDWIGIFNVFAIVDRFESAPKLPFARAFFPEARRASELRDDREGLGRERPPGRTIFAKLRNDVGAPAFDRALDVYLSSPSSSGESPSFREAVGIAAGRSPDRVLADWTEPYPEPLDYALADVELNSSAAASGADRYAHRFSILRDAERPIQEAVAIEVRGKADDERVQLTWNDARPRADFSIATPWRAHRVLLDPDRRLLEDDRAGSAVPAPLQVVLDSADVTVTSSQFGLSGLFVARRRYDYAKDLGIIAYFSNRSVGLHVGPRWHFGPRNDANTYRHNVYGYYTAAALRGDFRDESRPGRGDDGVLSGLGFRYDFTNQYAWDNPTDETKVRLFADWFGGGLGSDYDFVDWGVRMSFVRPLLTHRTLLAVQLMNAYSAPIDSRVPNQARYALGGDLGVRAVPVDDRLGENIALARFELRQTIYPEVDHNFFDWVTFRHGQLRLFVDAGRVEDRRSSLYRPSDYAVGVGIGVAGMYDFMGFFPSVAYLAVAQRIDDVDESGVQFLFGTRQAF